jgi:hypothetical protein
MNSSAANAATKTITKAKFGGGDMVRRTVGPVRYLGHLIGDGQWRGAGDKHPDGKTTLQAGSWVYLIAHDRGGRRVFLENELAQW